MSKANTSVVIVSYNTGPVLARCIEAVLAQRGLDKIILVDNGNTEAAQERLDRWAAREKRISIIRGQGNIGFASGCNLGARNITSKYILFLNPDCLLQKDTLLNMENEMESHSDAWLAGCCMVNHDGSPQGGSARNLLTLKVALAETFYLYSFLPRYKAERLNIDDIVENSVSPSYVPAISGAFMMIPRKRYEELGGMDERYFFHVEDLDFCLHIKQMGGKILHVPAVKCTHFRSSSNVSAGFIEKNKSRGFIQYFQKNYRNDFAPGVFPLLVMGIYFRLYMRLIQVFCKSLFIRPAAQRMLSRQELQASFLEGDCAHDKAISKAQQPVLLTGASGQVGLAILRWLTRSNVKIMALFHTTAIDFTNSNLSWAQTDLHNPIDLQDYTPKTLIHTPPIWLLPSHIDSLAKAGVKRVICFSSTSITSKADTSNIKEQKLIRKMADAERDIIKKCDELGIKWTIFRPTLIYGIGLDRNVSSIVSFIKKFKFFPLYGGGIGKRQPVHALDLAAAAIECVDNTETFNKIYVLSGGEVLSYRDMVVRIFGVIGKKQKIIHTSFLPSLLDIAGWLKPRSELNGDVARRMNTDQSYSHEEASRDFDYHPRKFLEEVHVLPEKHKEAV